MPMRGNINQQQTTSRLQLAARSSQASKVALHHICWSASTPALLACPVAQHHFQLTTHFHEHSDPAPALGLAGRYTGWPRRA